MRDAPAHPSSYAVRELRPLGEVRERIALLGKYAFQESAWEVFSEWLGIPAATAPGWVRAIAAASSATLLLLATAAFVTAIPRGAVKLIASLQNEAKPLKQVLREHLPTLKPGTPIVVMIGPEGDFTPAEIGQARSA